MIIEDSREQRPLDDRCSIRLSPHIRNCAAAVRRSVLAAGAWGLALCAAATALASDHADPIDPFNRERLEGGITDLFAFPVMADDSPAFPFEGNALLSLAEPVTDVAREPLTDEQRSEMDALVIIICVRRALTQTGSLALTPYTYEVNLDLHSDVAFAQEDAPGAGMPSTAGSGYAPSGAAGEKKPPRPTPHEAFLRYGGAIQRPDKIESDVTITFALDDKAGFRAGFPKYGGPVGDSWNQQGDAIQATSGVFDDPFIFPPFFRTNIVAMAVRIPMKMLRGRQDILIWATSHKGERQVDHVGRSLRTQNPRFELLNTLHPRDHVQAITEEHEHPSLMRDLALRFNFGNMFAYRRWDFVPDVMIFTTKYPVGFPNGRLLTDDVAARLAQYGDTLLFELSYQPDNSNWPRQRVNDRNDGKFKPKFPYLLDPWPDRAPPEPPHLSDASRMKLWGIAAAIVGVLVLENVIVARWYCRRKLRRRNL